MSPRAIGTFFCRSGSLARPAQALRHFPWPLASEPGGTPFPCARQGSPVGAVKPWTYHRPLADVAVEADRAARLNPSITAAGLA